MVEQDSTQTQKKCIACREKIASDASICPKCRSSQKLQWWTNLLSIFKWIGGFTALISLIIGVQQVGSIITQWKEKDKTIKDIVVSSEMLVEMKDYPTSWKIIQKAASIDAGSNRAFNQQVDIAMEWLRNIWLQKNQKEYTKSIEPFNFDSFTKCGNRRH